MKKTNLILPLILALALPLAFAQSGLEKINDYNQKQAVFYLQNLSFFVAFIGGILSVLLPCTLAILPAFFAYTFKERKEITKMTLVFFAGFSMIFVLLGIFSAVIGGTLTSIQVTNTSTLIFIAGIFLIIFGIMTMLGIGFNFIRIGKQTGHDISGVFLFGVIFGLGWSACLGPVLAGILLIASTFHNYFYAGALLFFYSLGLFAPLFLISILFDKYNLTQKSWLRGREFEMKLFGKIFYIHTTKIIAGILLISAGIVFIAFNGTNFINVWDPFRTSVYGYIFEDRLLGIPNINYIGLAVFAIFIIIVGYFFYKKSRE